ncbi:hypothetical protein [Paenibacillus senegalensis]|uniref:hypothetical protein n=1 Tax=Paenibacillus senegalensis TaxID=1465766 RepID=UPI001B3170CE|nr:hypothetical protein [Paenibacillus senegalensis]
MFVFKQNENEIGIRFDKFLWEDVEQMRKLRGGWWNPELKAWLIPYTLAGLESFVSTFREKQIRFDSHLLEECTLLQDWLEDNSESDSVEVKLIWGEDQKKRLCDALVARGYSKKR